MNLKFVPESSNKDDCHLLSSASSENKKLLEQRCLIHPKFSIHSHPPCRMDVQYLLRLLSKMQMFSSYLKYLHIFLGACLKQIYYVLRQKLLKSMGIFSKQFRKHILNVYELLVWFKPRKLPAHVLETIY